MAHVTITPPPIVFIHGTKGSHLEKEKASSCSGCKERQYLTLWQAAGWSTPDLSLPLKRDANGVQEMDGIVPGDVLDSITFLGFSLQDVYKPFTTWAKSYAKNQGTTLNVFTYDWRRGLQESSNKFRTYIKQVIADTKSTNGVQLISHSMGGLISLPLINESPELFHSVIFAGVPFGPSVGMLNDFSFANSTDSGNKTGRNEDIFTPAKWLTQPSAWHLIRLGQLSNGKKLCVDENGDEVGLDIYDINAYKKYKIGPYHASTGVTMDDDKEAFFVETLSQAKAYSLKTSKEFCQSLVNDDAVDYPPIACLIGKGQEMHCSTSIVTLRGTVPIDGDGSVYAINAVAPVPHEAFFTSFTHMTLLNDTTTVSSIVASLNEKRTQKNNKQNSKI